MHQTGNSIRLLTGELAETDFSVQELICRQQSSQARRSCRCEVSPGSLSKYPSQPRRIYLLSHHTRFLTLHQRHTSLIHRPLCSLPSTRFISYTFFPIRTMHATITADSELLLRHAMCPNSCRSRRVCKSTRQFEMKTASSCSRLALHPSTTT